MNYARETIQKAFKIYQEKHGGSLAEVSILFVNVMDALEEAAQQSVQRTVSTCQHSRAYPVDSVRLCPDCNSVLPAKRVTQAVGRTLCPERNQNGL